MSSGGHAGPSASVPSAFKAFVRASTGPLACPDGPLPGSARRGWGAVLGLSLFQTILRYCPFYMGLVVGGTLRPVGPGAVVLLVYMGLISVATYSLWPFVLSCNPVSRVSVFGFMDPVFGFILSVALLSEGSVIDPPRALSALALVSLGIIIVNHVP